MTSTAADKSREGTPSRSGLLAGVALWLTFSLLAVIARGVRWDETLEHAQVIAGIVQYPEGHPLFRYARGAFSLQTYLSAAIVWLGAGSGCVCGFRNFLFLAASVLPVFLLTAHLSGKAVWGHIAALLTLQGILLEFDGSYPLAVWPELYSNGPVGGGYALLVLYFLVAGHWRTGYFLLGLMPCIHVGQMPPVLAVGMLCTGWALRSGQRGRLSRAIVWGCLGLAPCMLFLAVQRAVFAVPPPGGGPYNVTGDAHAIWQAYTALHDVHRRLPPGNGHVILAALLLIGVASARLEARGPHAGAGRPCLGLLLYGVVTAVTVWGIVLVYRTMGAATPFLLIGWMPYRLINHAPFLVLAMSLGVLARNRKPGRALVLLVLLYSATLPLTSRVLYTGALARYAVGDAWVFFGLYGAAMGALLAALDSKRWAVLAGMALLGLGLYHQFGAACCLCGGIMAYALLRLEKSRGTASPGLGSEFLLASLCAILAAIHLYHQMLGHQWLPTSPFERNVAARVSAEGALLVSPPEAYLLQAKTKCPVLAENATPSYISYMPDLGPVIQAIFMDVYAISLEEAAPRTPWQQVWADRSREEWGALARKYEFRYVVSGEGVSLDLPLVFEEGARGLYCSSTLSTPSTALVQGARH